MKRPLLIAGIVVGALLTLAPLWGVLGTVLGMTRAFRVLGDSGIADPKQLSGAIGDTLVLTATGLFLCPFGIALLAVSLVLLFKDKPAAKPPPLPEHEPR